MLQLVRKDLLVLKYYYLFVLAYALFFGIIMSEGGRSFLFIAIMSGIMLTGLATSLEVKNKSSLFLYSLPVDRKQMVLAKYAGLLVFGLIGITVALATQLFIYAMDQVFAVTVSDVAIVASTLLVIGSVYFPVYFWLGAKGTQIVFLVSMFIGVAAGLAAEQLLGVDMSNMISIDGGNSQLMLMLLGTFALYTLSAIASLAIYRRKDLN